MKVISKENKPFFRNMELKRPLKFLGAQIKSERLVEKNTGWIMLRRVNKLKKLTKSACKRNTVVIILFRQTKLKKK